MGWRDSKRNNCWKQWRNDPNSVGENLKDNEINEENSSLSARNALRIIPLALFLFELVNG